jgi:hypothetical protein
MTENMFRLTALALAVIAASRASAQTELRWKLQPGEQFAVSVAQQTTSDVAYSGKNVTTQIDLAMELGWTVTAADEKAITIKQSLRRLTFKMESPKVGKVTYDSADKSRPSGQAREVAAAVAPLMSAEILLEMSQRGEVLSVKPANEAAEKLLANGSDSADGSLVSKQAIQQLLRQSLVTLPERAVNDGDTWTTTVSIDSALGKGQQKTTFTYAGAAEEEGAKVAKIDVASKLDLAAPAASSNKPLVKDHQQTGTVLFSTEQGRVVSGKQSQTLVTERPYRETMIVVTLKSEQTTTLKPVNASP